MSSTTKFKFMDLPEEIREKIFREAVSITNNKAWQRIWRADYWDLDAGLTWEVPFNIFTINRQLSREALEVFHRENKLVFIKCHWPAFLMDTVAKVIPLKFVTRRPNHVALYMELCWGNRHQGDGLWYPESSTTEYPDRQIESLMPENHIFNDCALFAAEELPKLVQLINCSYSSPLTSGLGQEPESTSAKLCRIYFDFDISSSFYKGNSRLAERLADKLKGLRKFEELEDPSGGEAPLVNPGCREFFFEGLSSKAIEEFRESSNLQQWTEAEALAEVSRIKAVGDKYASTGDNFAARAQYIIAGLMLDCRAFPRLREPRPMEEPKLPFDYAVVCISLWLSAAKVSENLQGFATCAQCVERPDFFTGRCPCKACDWGTLDPQYYQQPELEHTWQNPNPKLCDKKCEARHLRTLARRILRNSFYFEEIYPDRGCRTDEQAENLVVMYCKDYMEHGDWKEARSQLHWALHKLPDSQALQDLLDEVNSQRPKSNRRTRWRASKEQRKQAAGPQAPKQRAVTVERPLLEEFLQLSLFDQQARALAQPNEFRS